MPPYLNCPACWQSLWPLPVTAAVLAFLGIVLARGEDRSRELWLALAAFSMLGIVTGYMTGLSRSPAVSAVLPSVLSLLSGGILFMLGKDNAKRAQVSLAVLLFSLALVTGATWGAVNRKVAEEYGNTLDAQRDFIDEEKAILDYRSRRGLPSAPPGKAAGKHQEE